MMQRVGVFLSLIFLLSACQMEQNASSDVPFDKEKWAQKAGKVNILNSYNQNNRYNYGNFSSALRFFIKKIYP